jgi:hypothetical protein
MAALVVAGVREQSFLLPARILTSELATSGPTAAVLHLREGVSLAEKADHRASQINRLVRAKFRYAQISGYACFFSAVLKAANYLKVTRNPRLSFDCRYHTVLDRLARIEDVNSYRTPLRARNEG